MSEEWIQAKYEPESRMPNCFVSPYCIFDNSPDTSIKIGWVPVGALVPVPTTNRRKINFSKKPEKQAYQRKWQQASTQPEYGGVFLKYDKDRKLQIKQQWLENK